MKHEVTVVDYGVGNLLSVQQALEHCGASAVVTASPDLIASAGRLVIPGVGAFADGMDELNRRELVDPIRSYAASGRPLLGICLGMQLLFSLSEEFGVHQGLDLIPGRVVAIANETSDGRWRKTPHIGWNELQRPDSARDWQNTILEDVPVGSAVYFVHSFAAVPDNPSARLAECDYDGALICAAVRFGNISGCQFHPEKSGKIGLQVIRNYLRDASR